MSRWIVASLSPSEAEGFVRTLEPGMIVQVFYGKNPNARLTGQDIEDSRRAIDRGISPQQFTGKFEKWDINSRGEFYFVLKGVCEREMGFRAFNPSHGKLMKIHQLGSLRR